jgi:imidazolonepropionase-like amidohydrolase
MVGKAEGVEPFVLSHATVVVGDKKGTVYHDTSVVIGADGKIEKVAPTAQTEVPAGYHNLDASGKVVTPGLINGHVHLMSDGSPLDPKMLTPENKIRLAKALRSPVGRPLLYERAKKNALTLLHSGVTTFRSQGDIWYADVAVRNHVNSGHLLGPHILASGPLLATVGGHGAPLIALECADVDAARTNAEQNLDHGADVIKIAATGGVVDSQKLGEAGSPQMSVDQMKAICDVVHADGKIVSAHAQSPEGVKNALEAGVDTIEHGAPLDDEMIDLYLHNPRSLRGFSAVEPTLSAALPLSEIEQSVTGITDVQLQNTKHVGAGMIKGAKQAREAGIPVGVGTDSAMTFDTQYGTWREMQLFVDYLGMSKTEAFYDGTLGEAEILGIADHTGSVTEGKQADLIVLDKNPLEDLHTLDDPELVIVSGQPVWHPEVTRLPEVDAILRQTFGF